MDKMKVTSVVEREDGSAEFTGDLNPKELQFVIDIGLNFLLQHGITVVDGSRAQVHTQPEGMQ